MVVLSGMIWNSGNDDDPVVAVGEGLVVAAAEGRVAADGGGCCDAVALVGVDQCLDCSCILE